VKNELCAVAPFSDLPGHNFTSALNNNRNMDRWYQDWELVKWSSDCRLFPARYFIAMPKTEEELRIARTRRRAKFDVEGAKMRELLARAGVEVV